MTDHGALLRKALREIQSLRSALAEAKSASREPIAIVGMACRFPGNANSPAQFWELLRSGTDAITEVPRSRWDIDALYDADPDAPGKMYTRFGGFLEDIDRFDAQFFGVSPLDAMNMDPQQRLLLEVAWEAFEDAGIVPDDAPRTGVFVGSFMDDYLQSNFFAADRREIDAYNTLGLLRGLAAGRLAYTLNLQGPAMQLDTACSSSLLTAHLAVQALRNRECDLALSGGVNLILAPEVTVGLCRMRAMSADGRCKSFDASADGYVRGEGCGIVVLKRLADAMADRDRIYAVIRGSAANHDGRSNGLTAPNGTAQKTLIRDALDAAGVAPQDIQYVEAHGTGTSLGDPIEALALAEVLCAERNAPLLIGSVKSNVGHLESAAGVAALMKTALSLHHGAIPPSLHFREPNPHIPWERLPLSVPTALTPAELLFAGVSSFGMSGTNVHLVLEHAPPARAAEASDAPNVLTLSAATAEALEELVRNYKLPEGASLRDICDTSNRGRKHFAHRLAIPADSVESLAEALKAASASLVRGQPVAGAWPGSAAGRAGKANTVSLPTYPFQRQRFWVPKRRTRTQDGARRIPFSNDVHFELPLSETSELRDHRLGNSIVVPAGAYLALALEHLDATTLRDVTFPAPLTLEGETTLHLVASDTAFRFGTQRGDEWIAHCTGSYDRTAAHTAATRPHIAAEPLVVSADAGFTLGPSFQWIRNLAGNGDEVFCDLERPPAAASNAGLIDSALRTRSVMLDEVHVPFHIDELRVFAKPQAALFCHSTAQSIQLFDGDAAVMEIRGFAVRKLEREKELPLLRVEWQPAEVAAAGEHLDVFEFSNVLALRDTPNVRFITHGAQAVRAGDAVDPAHAWVWGLVKTAAIEQPRLNWSCVDLDPRAPVDEQLPLLANTPREHMIAFRSGRAYVPRLVPATIPPAPPIRFRDDAAYATTGASGALGGLVARWLVQHGARHLILISRTAPKLEGLDDANVRIVIADVATDANLLDSAVPVKGILHAAGVLDDALLHDLTPEHFARVFAPKVAGTWNLHQQSLGLDLDFFVCFSSAASLIGSRGQANYAAANAYVDALIQHRRSSGLKGLSINWSAWADAGMAKDVSQQMASIGIEPIDPRDGLATLGRLLPSDAAQIGVIPADWPKLLGALYGTPPPFFEKFAVQSAHDDRILPLLEKTPPEARRERLEAHLKHLVVAVMGRDAFAGAGDDPTFFELGMDSLMSLDLRNRLQDELDRTLPSTVALEYPAVRELADYLIAAVLPAGMFA